MSIPSTVTSIGAYAFYGCRGLTSVTIPSSVTSIGESAFSGCSGLKTVAILSKEISIGDSAFYNCGGLADENGFVIVHNALYGYYGSATSLTIPSSVTSIGCSAFSGCGIISIIIPEGVERIGDYAFGGCMDLRSVTIPSSMRYVGSSAFETRSTIEKVIVSDLDAYASIYFVDPMSNPRNNAQYLYVDDELRDEMCTVSYTLYAKDFDEYDWLYWYAEFVGYDENWSIDDYRMTASCSVPIGTTVNFDDLTNGQIYINEWGDHAFDGWEGDGVCAVSNTEVVAKWKAKTLPEVLEMLMYGGAGYPLACVNVQYLFLDSNSGCCRSQGELRIGRKDPITT